MSKQQGELYWYFACEDKKLRYDDNRKIVLGKTHTVKCKPVLCQSGLHASKRAIDALQYAPGPIVYRVELSGDVVHGEDKSVATKRKYVAGGIDATPILRAFARKCALDVVHLWSAPDVVVEYLKTGDESIRDAAWAAARDAAWAAARDAARDAAWAAARDAAWAAARDAAWAAARDAAWYAAWAAARDAAWYAAWDAAWDAQNEYFTELLEDAIRGDK